MLIDGKKLAEKKVLKLQKKVKKLQKMGIEPKCLALIATEDPEGKFYNTKLKGTLAKKVGIVYGHKLFSFTNRKQMREIPQLIKKLDSDPLVHGIILQKPSKEVILKYFNNINKFQKFWIKATSEISPQKDIDCLNAKSLGELLIGQPFFLPATVKSIWEILLHYYKSEKKLEGKNIVVIGSSEILGKPLALLLKDKGATVCLCGSKTKQLKRICQWGEIIISCVGKPNLISKEMVNRKTVVVDAGTKKVGKKVYGDADFDRLKSLVKAITPVPGGVGPMTIACLLENVVESAKKLSKIS